MWGAYGHRGTCDKGARMATRACAVRGGPARPQERACLWGACGNRGACLEGTYGQGVRTCVPLLMAAASCYIGGVGAYVCAQNWECKWEASTLLKKEGIYVLSSSFEVAKPSPLSSLISTCKVLYLGLWKLGHLALHI